ncbi:MAG: hypothetical protein A2079_05695 [Geobacteraceae bacterium GWC2_48_7]|nr:MAG: hypothetical protein A2X80_06960 [Geobacteraceae bacterium GWB2_52_12]OGU01015.1 MAG: hypothetical protein A2079_05695 [Geobacteraceae bacterium GWC2_48_7]
MKSIKSIVAAALLIFLAVTADAADTLRLGVRGGAALNKSSLFTEAFGDLYLNRLISIGATAGFVAIDRDNNLSVKRDESVPITALFKVHAPIPLIKPYVGLGEALVFHDKRGVKGTPVALAGLNFDLGLLPVFLNLEYRRQFNDQLDFLGGGLGVRF